METNQTGYFLIPVQIQDYVLAVDRPGPEFLEQATVKALEERLSLEGFSFVVVDA